MNEIPKVVFSKTLGERPGRDRRSHAAIAEEIARQRQPGGDYCLGRELAQSLCGRGRTNMSP
jgi:hypothetical protein